LASVAVSVNGYVPPLISEALLSVPALNVAPDDPSDVHVQVIDPEPPVVPNVYEYAAPTVPTGGCPVISNLRPRRVKIILRKGYSMVTRYVASTGGLFRFAVSVIVIVM
jgi:hypothetical protein